MFPWRYASIAPRGEDGFEYEQYVFDHHEPDHHHHHHHHHRSDNDDVDAGVHAWQRHRRTSLLEIRVPNAGDVDSVADRDGERRASNAMPTPHALSIPHEAHAAVVPADVLDNTALLQQADAQGFSAGSVIHADAGSVFPKGSSVEIRAGRHVYKLVRLTGQGAFSCVWLGQEVAGAEAGWPVAVKMIARAREKRGHGHRWGKRARASFLREAEMLKVRLPLSSLPFPPSLTDPLLTHACSRTKTAPVYPRVPLPAHAACHACARDAPSHTCAQARAWQRALRCHQLGHAARVHAPLHMDGAG